MPWPETVDIRRKGNGLRDRGLLSEERRHPPVGTKAPTLYRASWVCVRGLRRAGWQLVWEAEPWAAAPASLSPVPTACGVMEEKAETGPTWPVPPSLLHCSDQETPKHSAHRNAQYFHDVSFPNPIRRFSEIPILEEELLAVIFNWKCLLNWFPKRPSYKLPIPSHRQHV